MHELTPYENWTRYYESSKDPNSPFYGKEYDLNIFTDNIYGYYIDPAWDYIGSDTLYLKILYANYELNFCVIEMFGEWNDAINNDVMHLKRNIIDHLILQGINCFVVIGENVFNFHGSDDLYYEEWFEELDEGWIAAINFRDFVLEEFTRYNVDSYINYGGNLQIANWRTFPPRKLFEMISGLINRRLGM